MLYAVYAIVLLLLSIYSYSQIDLNLTLSSNQLYQMFQQQLIFLGYYHRPLSASIFAILLIFLYLIYFKILSSVTKNKLSVKNIVWLVIFTSTILFFSYSLFSHDLFNYMFDARIVTKYYQNPYIHSALDYPADLWTRFMHWTHRTYPYGPVWLILTIPFSFIGLGKFVLTLLSFKLMFAIFHVGNIYLIYKILTKTDPKLSLLATSVYAFNPVILIESSVSPHNEVVMLFFLLLAIYQNFVKRKRLLGVISLLLSAGVKFITIILLPLFILRPPGRSSLQDKPSGPASWRIAKRLLEGEYWLKLNLLLLTPPFLLQIYYREPYAWYFIPLIGLAALLIKYKSINIFISGVSLAALLRYLPFLYTGEYSQSVRDTQNLLFLITVILTTGFTFLSLRGAKRSR